MSAVPTFRRSLTQASIAFLGAIALGIAACGGGGGGSGDGALGNDPPTSTGRATVLGASLNAPWGLAFLPNGRMLVTQKGGAVVLVSADGNSVLAQLTGPPAVSTAGQGGLLDIALDTDFASSRWVYMTFSQSGAGGTGTALARGRLNASLDAWQETPQAIWQQTPKVNGEVHYGARIAWRTDGTLYLTVGERGYEGNDGSARADGVQSAANTLGKVVRLDRNGAPVGGGLGVWSTGHRNPQGAAVRPGSNDLWLTEHGPQGGDELNRVGDAAGGNFGWPLKSYGCAYGAPVGDACRIGGGAHSPSYVEPRTTWTPTSTAPSGLAFYNGDAFPDWRGNLFTGALAGTTLWRIVLDGSGNVASRQEVAAVKALGARIRDVRQGPDGNLYLLTDGSGNNASRIVRVAP